MTDSGSVRNGGIPLDISSPGKKNAVIPSIIREEAIDIAESMRRKKILGRGIEEHIISTGLIWWPFVHITIRYKGGIIRRQMKETEFLIDGLTAEGLTVDKGYKRYPLFSGITDLDSISVMVLASINREGATVEEIGPVAGMTDNEMKKVLQKLEKKRLVTSSILSNRKKMYMTLLRNELPKIHGLRGNIPPDLPLRHLEGISRPLSFSEDEISRILKGLEPECGITGFHTYYYPVYEVLLDDNRRNTRPLLIDGRTGKEIIAER